MKFKKWMQIVLVGCCIVTLAACSTGRKKRDISAINEANASYGSAESSGVGEEARFGDSGSESRSALSRRVYYFDFDSNVVHEADKPAIKANANYLLAHSRAKIMLEGHTDPRGSREYNIGLGERRAKSVAELLAANGVSPSQMRIVSYGAEKPVSQGHTEADYQKDRRVVLVYLQR